VLLAGDAAHVHSPAGGQGMNTSIQDAANLGWKLAATILGWAPEGLLNSYDAERHPVGRMVLRRSGAMLRIGLTGPALLTRARTLLIGAVAAIPQARNLVGVTVSGIDISYPAPRGSHPLTGTRARDLPLADSRRLYEALRDGRFVLTTDDSLPDDVIRGYAGRVTAATTAVPTGTIRLVRPDAYIAWAADTGSPAYGGTASVREALARSCGVPMV
jgi:hypothetical protein